MARKTDRVKMQHPDTKAEIEVAASAQKHLVQSGWAVAAGKSEEKTTGKAPGDNVSGEQKK